MVQWNHREVYGHSGNYGHREVYGHSGNYGHRGIYETIDSMESELVTYGCRHQ